MKTYIYRDQKRVELTDAFLKHLDNVNCILFYMKNGDMVLHEKHETFYDLYNQLCINNTFKDFKRDKNKKSCLKNYSESYNKAVDHYDEIYTSIIRITYASILSDDFNHTLFYRMLVQHDYIKELN